MLALCRAAHPRVSEISARKRKRKSAPLEKTAFFGIMRVLNSSLLIATFIPPADDAGGAIKDFAAQLHNRGVTEAVFENDFPYTQALLKYGITECPLPGSRAFYPERTALFWLGAGAADSVAAISCGNAEPEVLRALRALSGRVRHLAVIGSREDGLTEYLRSEFGVSALSGSAAAAGGRCTVLDICGGAQAETVITGAEYIPPPGLGRLTNFNKSRVVEGLLRNGASGVDWLPISRVVLRSGNVR